MFPQRLKELRLERGFTQEYIGKMLHVSYKTVGAWERGTRQPSIETIQKLSNMFAVSTDYLLGNKLDEPNLTVKNDLKKFLDENLEKGMTYANEELTDEDKEKLKVALTQIFWKYHKNKE